MSNSSASATASVGPGFLGLLTLLLIGGKLFAPAVATYSWWVAFAPTLFGFVIFLVVIGSFLALYLSDERARKRRKKAFR